MNINGKHFRTIWLDEEDESTVKIIDQRPLPHRFVIESLSTVENVFTAIRDMHVRGAGLIGAAAGYGMYLACLEAEKSSDPLAHIKLSANRLLSARPTAVNLSYAIELQLNQLLKLSSTNDWIAVSKKLAIEIADADSQACYNIGRHGLPLIQSISTRKVGSTVNILTHCNAGWLAFVDFGSATAPIYAAHDTGIDIHVWVDETRPRNQGSRLTAWELEQHGVPFTIISDNTGGHLMQNGLVDMVIVGSDRTTYTGDVANKIGTYLKALAAQDNDIPFYVALPSSTFDWDIKDGVKDIPIEQRDAEEVKFIQGMAGDQLSTVLLTSPGASAANFAFDVTPSRLVTGLITERGICQANSHSILSLFPERNKNNG